MPVSCIAHRPNGRFHILFEDLRLIAADDIVNASVLRVLEQKTDERIKYLCNHYSIPDDQLPHDDLLWIDEEDASLREIERWSIGMRRKSSFARALKDRNPDKLPASLIQLGYVKRRWIARRGDKAWPVRAHALIQRDEQGPFLLVEEGSGDYHGIDGRKHNAAIEGYSDISKQFLLCFEKVDAAIAALDGYDPPEPLQRWQQKSSASTGIHRNLVPDASTAQTNTPTDTAGQRGNSVSASSYDAFGKQNTTTGGLLSIRTDSEAAGSTTVAPCPKLDRGVQKNAGASKKTRGRPTSPESLSKNTSPLNKNLEVIQSNTITSKKDSVSLVSTGIDFESLRTAPRTVETWLGLLSSILPVPDRAQTDPDVWDRDWQRPTQRLLAATSTLSDLLAWERTGITASYMTDEESPSWWVQERARKSLVTARHVADNYTAQWKNCQTKQWRPAHLVAYDGPPLDYAAGYAGVTQAIVAPAPPEEVAPEPPIIVEEPEIPAQPAWMTQEQATALYYGIDGDLLAAITRNRTSGHWYASIQCGDRDDDWYHFENEAAWLRPSSEAVDAIEAARRYASECTVIPTEVIEATPEPIIAVVPPSSSEPPDTVTPGEEYLSMEELTSELQRGLCPVVIDAVSIVLDAAAPTTEELAPPFQATAKLGMSLFVAGALLRQIVASGYHAESVPNRRADRAYVAVEVGPGDWQDFESAAAWQVWRKSARASPGSIGAVIAAAGVQGQAMEARQ